MTGAPSGCNTNGKSIQLDAVVYAGRYNTTSSSWSMTTGRRHGRFPDHCHYREQRQCAAGAYKSRQQDRQREYCPLFYPFGDGRQWRCAGLFMTGLHQGPHSREINSAGRRRIRRPAYTTSSSWSMTTGHPSWRLPDHRHYREQRQCSARAFRPRSQDYAGRTITVVQLIATDANNDP